MVGLAVAGAVAFAAWQLQPPARDSLPPAPPAPPVIVAPAPPEPPPPPPPPTPDQRHTACLALAGTDAAAALREAEAFLAASGEPHLKDWAEHCAASAQLALGQLEQAATRLERLGMAAGRDASDRASLLAQAGQVWLMAGDAARAYSTATLALVVTPDDIELLTDRAIALVSLGRNFEAIDDLNRVIDLDPARAEAFVFRAGAWRQSGRPELAEDDIARALAIDPGNAEAYLERGFLRAAAGRAADARADWQRAAERAPGSPTEELARTQIENLDRSRPR